MLVDEPVNVIQDFFLTLCEGHSFSLLGRNPNKNRIQDTRTLPETQGPRMAGGILDRIVETKRREVEALLPSEGELLKRVIKAPPPRDLVRALRREGEVAVMAEVKRRPPQSFPCGASSGTRAR